MKRKRFEITNRLTSRVSNSLNIYLRELNNIPEVSTERIDELFYQYYYGDESVKDLLIRHNLRFVITVAKSYTSNIETLMDLINEGNYGLIIDDILLTLIIIESFILIIFHNFDDWS